MTVAVTSSRPRASRRHGLADRTSAGTGGASVARDDDAGGEATPVGPANVRSALNDGDELEAVSIEPTGMHSPTGASRRTSQHETTTWADHTRGKIKKLRV
jgi:hypothetical protein